MTKKRMTTKPKRLLLKLSGETLANTEALSGLLDQVALLQPKIAFAMVVGGGNILRGRQTPYQKIQRTQADAIGMCASILNGLLLQAAAIEAGLCAKVFSFFAMPHMTETLTDKALQQCFDDKAIPIFAGGTGHPYVSTDTAAVLYALRAGCDVLLKATKVDGVFDKDPTTHATAKLLPFLTYEDMMQKPCALFDSAAVALARDYQLPLKIFNAKRHKGLESTLDSVPPFTQIASGG
ncbi:MAG: hypothetical protein V6Z78_04305 [Holosporaceae bacterium]